MHQRPLFVVACIVALFAVSPSATADTSGRSDLAGDVRAVTIDAQGKPVGSPRTVPDRTIGDVVATRIEHTATSVRVRVTYRGLTPNGFLNQHYVRIRSDRSDRYVTIVAGVEQGWAGVGAVGNVGQSSSVMRCPGLAHRIDYRTKQLFLTIPRSCLGNPTFVKVGVLFAAEVGSTRFYDDALKAYGAGGPTLSLGVYR